MNITICDDYVFFDGLFMEYSFVTQLTKKLFFLSLYLSLFPFFESYGTLKNRNAHGMPRTLGWT